MPIIISPAVPPFNAGTLTVTTVNAANANITSTATIATANVTSAVINAATVTTGTVTTINVANATITSTATISTAAINTISVTTGTAGEWSITQTATFATVGAGAFSPTSINCTGAAQIGTATITNLVGTNYTLGEGTITTATIATAAITTANLDQASANYLTNVGSMTYGSLEWREASSPLFIPQVAEPASGTYPTVTVSVSALEAGDILRFSTDGCDTNVYPSGPPLQDISYLIVATTEITYTSAASTETEGLSIWSIECTLGTDDTEQASNLVTLMTYSTWTRLGSWNTITAADGTITLTGTHWRDTAPPDPVVVGTGTCTVTTVTTGVTSGAGARKIGSIINSGADLWVAAVTDQSGWLPGTWNKFTRAGTV